MKVHALDTSQLISDAHWHTALEFWFPGHGSFLGCIRRFHLYGWQCEESIYPWERLKMNLSLQPLRPSWLLDQMSPRHSQRHIINTSANNGSQSITRCRIAGNRLHHFWCSWTRKLPVFLCEKFGIFAFTETWSNFSLCCSGLCHVKGTTLLEINDKLYLKYAMYHYVRSVSLLKHGSVIHFLHKIFPLS